MCAIIYLCALFEWERPLIGAASAKAPRGKGAIVKGNMGIDIEDDDDDDVRFHFTH